MPATVRATRTPAVPRSRLPSGQLRQVGRAYADDPRPTLAELVAAPLDFTVHPDGTPRDDLPCLPPADPEWWFPVGSTSEAAKRELAAVKARCGPCPVRTACRDYAVRHRLQGIWGGTSEEDRTELRRNARRAG